MNQSMFGRKAIASTWLTITSMCYALLLKGARIFAPGSRATNGDYQAIVRLVLPRQGKDKQFVELYSSWTTSLIRAHVLSSFYRFILRRMYPDIKQQIIAYTLQSRTAVTRPPFWNPGLARAVFTSKGKFLLRTDSPTTILRRCHD